MANRKYTPKENIVEKKSDGLLFKFAIIFLMFTVLSLLCCGIATYFLQTRSYKRQVEDNVRHIAEYLQVLIKADDYDFVEYQKYLIEHKDEIIIPYDYDWNYLPAKERFDKLFSEQYPGKTLGEDISFDELSD